MSFPRHIPGIRDLPEPTFRTFEDALVSLDTLVDAVCDALGGQVSPVVCKCTIQMARYAMRDQERVDVGALAAEVSRELRPEHIVVTPPVVQGILMAYASEVARLGVAQVSEGWAHAR